MLAADRIAEQCRRIHELLAEKRTVDGRLAEMARQLTRHHISQRTAAEMRRQLTL